MENTLQQRVEQVLTSWAEIATRKPEAVQRLRTVYFDLFGTQVTQDCGSCYQKAYLRIQKFVYLREQNLTLDPLTMEKNLKDRKYLLKDGQVLQVEFGGDYVTNDNMTDEQAEALLKKYPALAVNFQRIPDSNTKAVKAQEKAEAEALVPHTPEVEPSSLAPIPTVSADDVQKAAELEASGETAKTTSKTTAKK